MGPGPVGDQPRQVQVGPVRLHDRGTRNKGLPPHHRFVQGRVDLVAHSRASTDLKEFRREFPLKRGRVSERRSYPTDDPIRQTFP